MVPEVSALSFCFKKVLSLVRVSGRFFSFEVIDVYSILSVKTNRYKNPEDLKTNRWTRTSGLVKYTGPIYFVVLFSS